MKSKLGPVKVILLMSFAFLMYFFLLHNSVLCKLFSSKSKMIKFFACILCLLFKFISCYFMLNFICLCKSLWFYRNAFNFIFSAPSIIVIEEFNYLCPSKNEAENLHFYISKSLSQFLKTLNVS